MRPLLPIRRLGAAAAAAAMLLLWAGAVGCGHNSTPTASAGDAAAGAAVPAAGAPPARAGAPPASLLTGTGRTPPPGSAMPPGGPHIPGMAQKPR